MFNKNLITKKVKLVGNAELEVWFDKEKGTFGSKVVGYGVSNAGRAFECKACGKAVVDNDYYNDMRFCPDCLNELKRQLMPKGEPTKLEEKKTTTPTKTYVKKCVKKIEKSKCKSSSKGSISGFLRNYKVQIVVPTLQEYLDVYVGLRSSKVKVDNLDKLKKLVLCLLDLIAKGNSREDITRKTGLNDHTVYCYLLEFRKVGLLTTKDNKVFHIVPPYHYVTEVK